MSDELENILETNSVEDLESQLVDRVLAIKDMVDNLAPKIENKKEPMEGSITIECSEETAVRLLSSLEGKNVVFRVV